MLTVLKRKTNIIIIETLSSQMFELVVSFLKNILLVRYVGVQVFGKYQFIAALFVFIDFGISALDTVLRRFYFESDARQRRLIFISNLGLKLVVFVFGAIAAISYKSLNGDKFADQERLIFACLLAYFFFNSFLSTLSSMAQSLKMYRNLNIINAALSFSTLILFLVAFFSHLFSQESFLLFYLGLNGFVVISKTLYLTQKLTRDHLSFSTTADFSFYEIFHVGLWKFRAYLYPQLVGNLSGYVINFIPILLLGHKAEFDKISYLEIIKKLFKYIHKIIPTAVRGMVPSIVEKAREKSFPSKWNKYTLTYMSFAMLLGIAMFFISEPVMSIYKVDFNETIKKLFLIYSLFLVWGAWAHSMDFLALAGTSAIPMSVNYFSRQAFAVVGYCLIFDQLNPVTLSMVTVSSVLVSVVIYIYWIYRYKKELFPYQKWAFLLAVGQLAVMLILYALDIRIRFSISLENFRSLI